MSVNKLEVVVTEQQAAGGSPPAAPPSPPSGGSPPRPPVPPAGPPGPSGDEPTGYRGLDPDMLRRISEATGRDNAERRRFDGESASREKERQQVADELERDRAAAVERDKAEQKRFAAEAASREKERQQVADELQAEKDDFMRRAMAAVERDKANRRGEDREAANRERQRAEEEAEKLRQQREAESAVEAAQAARMARFRTIAGAAQTMSGGGSGGLVSGGVQLAGAGVFGARAAAVAGGPVGIALAAAPLILDSLNRQADAFTNKLTGVGRSLAGEGRFNLSGGIREATKSLEAVPIVGQALALQLKRVTMGLVVMDETVQAFIARGRELQPYSSAISAANARAEVQRIRLDIDEARSVGPSIARLVEAQSELDATVRELLLPIKEVVADGLAEVMDGVKEVAQDVKPLAKVAAEAAAMTVKIGAIIGTAPIRTIGRVIRLTLVFLERSIGWLDRQEEKPAQQNNDLLQQVFDAAKAPLPRVTVDDPAAHAQEGRLALPRRGF